MKTKLNRGSPLLRFRMSANPSRDAFLTSSWIEFCKENYASEEKNEKEFQRKGCRADHWEGHRVFSVGRAPTPAKSTRVVPDVPSLPVCESDAFYPPPTGQRQSVERPYYMGSGYFFERSLKAEAVVDDSIINTLRLRLSKKNKLRLKSKFSIQGRS